MSMHDAFGPPPQHSLDSAAIAWVRSSIYSRMGKANRYRSPLSIAIMYAAELDAGDVKAGRLRKLEAGRASLEKLSAQEIENALAVVRRAKDAAPDDLSRGWAARACSVLSTIGAKLQPAPADPELAGMIVRRDRMMARRKELVAGGMSPEDASAQAISEDEATLRGARK